jgi:hypothetical protein
MSQKYAAYDSTGAIVAFYDSVDSPAPAGTSMIEITDDQWLECLATRGYTVSNGTLVAPAAPTEEDLLVAAKATKIVDLYEAYQADVQVSVEYTTVAGVGKTYQADTASQNTLLVATTGYNLAGATPTGFYWVAEDNTQVPFTLDDLKGLYAVMLQQGNVAFQKLQTLKGLVRSATTAGAATSVDWS